MNNAARSEGHQVRPPAERRGQIPCCDGGTAAKPEAAPPHRARPHQANRRPHRRIHWAWHRPRRRLRSRSRHRSSQRITVCLNVKVDDLDKLRQALKAAVSRSLRHSVAGMGHERRSPSAWPGRRWRSATPSITAGGSSRPGGGPAQLLKMACWTLYAVGLVILAGCRDTAWRAPDRAGGGIRRRGGFGTLADRRPHRRHAARAAVPCRLRRRMVGSQARRGSGSGGPRTIAVGCFAVLATWAILRVFPLGNVTGEEAGSQLARAFSPAAVWVQALLPLRGWSPGCTGCGAEAHSTGRRWGVCVGGMCWRGAAGW